MRGSLSAAGRRSEVEVPPAEGSQSHPSGSRPSELSSCSSAAFSLLFRAAAATVAGEGAPQTHTQTHTRTRTYSHVHSGADSAGVRLKAKRGSCSLPLITFFFPPPPPALFFVAY